MARMEARAGVLEKFNAPLIPSSGVLKISSLFQPRDPEWRKYIVIRHVPGRMTLTKRKPVPLAAE